MKQLIPLDLTLSLSIFPILRPTYSGPKTYTVATLIILLMSLAFVGEANAQFDEIDPSSKMIVGGEEADTGEFPWQVKLSNGCGGSLIHPRWVLTAAHCVFYLSTDIDLILGTNTPNTNDPNQQLIRSQKIIVHPNYDNITLDNDVALIELAQLAQLNQRVALIEILKREQIDPLAFPGTLATTAGWGALVENGDFPDNLQKVAVPIVEQSSCEQSNAPLLVTENMICAGYPEGGKDACGGDSGGPLIVPDNNGNWLQVGIVSWGIGCARPDRPGVYALASNYIEWIEENIAEHVPLGDVNCDGIANAIDALFITQHIVELRSDIGTCPLADTTTQLNATTADVNTDNVANAVDALFILQCTVNIPNAFCPEIAATEQEQIISAGLRPPSQTLREQLLLPLIIQE